ncbi:MAG TPA: DNA adenine methylase [Anaerolineales bacterium]|nr:DNA adenine methylase [Anaerolineales bacterium]
MDVQQSLFPDLTAQFPSTRYQGSKAKLTDWIWENLAGIDFASCIDAFGGTGAVAYRLKQTGKAVTYNDVLRLNYLTNDMAQAIDSMPPYRNLNEYSQWRSKPQRRKRSR